MYLSSKYLSFIIHLSLIYQHIISHHYIIYHSSFYSLSIIHVFIMYLSSVFLLSIYPPIIYHLYLSIIYHLSFIQSVVYLSYLYNSGLFGVMEVSIHSLKLQLPWRITESIGVHRIPCTSEVSIDGHSPRAILNHL